MDRTIQKHGLINWVALLAACVFTALVSRFAGSMAGLIGAMYLGLGFLVAVVSYFQMRLLDREQLEQLEFEELKKAKGDSSLFTEGASDTFPARQSKQQFDRFFVPVFTAFLFLVQGAAAYLFWNRIPTADPPDIGQATFSMALFGLAAIVLYLLGKYSAGLARLEGQALLRPSASYLMLGSFIGFLLAISEAAVWFQFPEADAYLARALVVLVGIVAVENLFALIFEIYRPRIKGQTSRMLYESRLIGLLGQPQGLITTAAQALDYQFGFKVSETWFYRFLEKALAWIILLQLAALLLSTTLLIIEPHEQAVLERFGKPVVGRPVLEPGLHLKLPWPLDRAYRFPTKEVQTFNVGFTPHEEEQFSDRVLIWTKSHYQEEEHLLVASHAQSVINSDSTTSQAVPVNLLVASIPVHYQVTDLLKWTYSHASPEAFLEQIAYREVVRYLVTVDILDIMSRERTEAAEALKQGIQQSADQKELGVKILFVGLQDIHPPVKVADAFEEVVNAIQESEAKKLTALGYYSETVSKAEAEAEERLAQARSYSFEKVASARAAAVQFTHRLEAFKASPSVFTERTYMKKLGEALRHTRKYVKGTQSSGDTYILNLEDKLRADLLDIDPTPDDN